MRMHQCHEVVRLCLAKVLGFWSCWDRYHSYKNSAKGSLTARQSSEAGNAILSVLIAIGIFGILSVSMTNMGSNSMKASKSVSYRQDLETIKKTISSRMDCKETLGINPASVLPLTCGGARHKLRRIGGGKIGSNPNMIGDWTISSKCINQKLIIQASMPGVKDPLTGRLLDDLPSNTTGTTVSEDLFGGSSNFCQSFYDPAFASCSGSGIYDKFKGSRKGKKLCCREITAMAGPPEYTSQPTCEADEWTMTGGGQCIYDGTLASTANPSFLHKSYTAPSAWGVDCYTVRGAESRTIGFAICCPKYN